VATENTTEVVTESTIGSILMVAVAIAVAEDTEDTRVDTQVEDTIEENITEDHIMDTTKDIMEVTINQSITDTTDITDVMEIMEDISRKLLYQIPSTGESKEPSLQLRIKDNADHAGPSPLPEVWREDIKSRTRASSPSLSNNSLTALRMETRVAMVV